MVYCDDTAFCNFSADTDLRSSNILETFVVGISSSEATDWVNSIGCLLRAHELSVLPDNITTLLYNPVKTINL